MRIKNFELVKIENQQIIEIKHLGEIFDLHNASEFLKVNYDVKASILTLFWNYYYKGDIIIPFQIKFEGVVYFDISLTNKEMPEDENDCLEEIVYNEKIEFIYRGGMKIVVRADEASFEKGSIG